MPTQAYFENIQKQIVKELSKADQSIRIVVAWFTDAELFDILCRKLEEGVAIEILLANHRFNKESGLDFNRFVRLGGSVWFVGDADERAPLMHNKFCIIDEVTLLFGSYNWTRKAQTNHESLTIVEDDKLLIIDFLQEFESLKASQTGENVAQVDWGKLVIRLEMLLNLIRLEDEEDISYQLSKIKKILPVTEKEKSLKDVYDILRKIDKKEYSKAVELLGHLLGRMKQLVVRSDEEIAALQLEIKSLEWQIASIENEYVELEKTIYKFSVQHSQQLGDLILLIFLLQQQVAQRENNQQETEEAKSNYQQYQHSHELNKKKIFVKLNQEEEKSIKDMYREASKICHPDKVADDQKEAAHLVFIELKEAYETNDLQRIEQLYRDIRNGIYGFSSQVLTHKEKLIHRRNILVEKRNSLEIKVISLKESDAYCKITCAGDWEEYFKQKKEELLKVKEELEEKLAQLEIL
ncbi:phospholipase D-like domain-containing protein [Telluribacter sp.]|jgi:hypothetical protein|uniref:phospholipase D-like domain-containing protein n=1 Tax=Telluribacter sp. TaxID=1978767 RepID=UPI002E107A29|nr:phospholipase D-like domain-containing protein [Telluribacter sp.]